MNYKDLFNYSKNFFEENNIDDSAIIVKLLIEYVFGITKEKLIIVFDDMVPEIELAHFKKLLQKISDGYPIQYITNNQEFMNLNFYVDENVLIPQPDTEILVEEVLKECSTIKNNVKLLDMCTGSGAIAISLAKYLNDVNITASDISFKALQVAKLNAEKNMVHKKINFIESDMFNNINEKEYDAIISNPPYIKTNIIKTLDRAVQKEPYIALDGGSDGLDFYKIIIENAHKYIKADGKLFLEIGYNQKEEVFSLLKKSSHYYDIKCIKDLSNNDRAIIATVRR